MVEDIKIDINNRWHDDVTGEFIEKPKNISKNGEFIGYHATKNNFSDFEIGDIGFHFGTEEQANNRVKEKAIMKKAILHIKNPLYMEDRTSWNVEPEMIMKLEKMGIASPEEARKLNLMYREDDHIGYDSSANKAMREFLESKGYDGIVYKNKYEGNGLTFIAFHNNQIEQIK